jgi:hypothetical protein
VYLHVEIRKSVEKSVEHTDDTVAIRREWGHGRLIDAVLADQIERDAHVVA